MAAFPKSVTGAVYAAAKVLYQAKLEHLGTLLKEVAWEPPLTVEVRVRTLEKLLLLRDAPIENRNEVWKVLRHIRWAINDVERFKHRHSRRHPVKE